MNDTSNSPSTVRFGDVARQITENEKNPLEAGFERYIGLEHLDPESLKIRRWGLIEEDNPTFTRVFRAGQVLFGRRRAYQRKAAVAEFDGVCSGDIIVMEAKPDRLLPELLPFIVQTEGFYEHALSTSAGSLSPRTKWSALAKYAFPLPPLDEQRRIAEILWAVEETIRQYYEIDVNFDIASRVVFNEFMSKGLGNPKVKRSQNFKTIPLHWTEITLEKACTRITDGEHATPPRITSGVYLLSARNVHNGKIILDDVDYISDETYQRLCERITPEPNDILITCSGTIGRVARVPENIRFALVRSVAILKLCDFIHPLYLELCLQSSFLQKQIRASINQLAQGNIFQKDIKRLVIPLPPFEEQVAISDKMLSFSLASERYVSHLEQLSSLKRQLLSNLVGSTSHV